MSCSPVDAGVKALAWKLGVTLLTLRGTEWERWEQILVSPSTAETEEKLVLTFRIGFRKRWRCKDRKKGIFLPLFAPLHPQSKLPPLPRLGGSGGLRMRTVLPIGSLHSSRIFLCCSSSVSELAAVVGRKRRAKKGDRVPMSFLLKARAILLDPYSHWFLQLFKGQYIQR